MAMGSAADVFLNAVASGRKGAGDGAVVWPTQEIWQSIAPVLPGFTIEVVQQIESTNTELMGRAREGRLAPVLLVAEQQTAGRGRLGRQWVSDQKGAQAAAGGSAAHAVASVGAQQTSLTFSIGLPLLPRNWSGLSLAVGVSIAHSLHPDLRLKWPNDIWWHDRKLAGILIETANVGDARFTVVGVGINIGKPVASDFNTAPAWLGELLPGVDAPQVLRLIAVELVRSIKVFEASGFSTFQQRFNERDALDGLTVSLSDGTVGVAQGVDEVGALRVLTTRGLTRITSAEVSVRYLA
jgi:BirA family biotin operon repressor/biotin-[acetyl-CoA-carboxylase] ligase